MRIGDSRYLRFSEDLTPCQLAEGLYPDQWGVADAFFEAVADVFGWLFCNEEGAAATAAVWGCGGGGGGGG